MTNFEKYRIGDIVTFASVGYLKETITKTPKPYVFDPKIDGYLAWLPPSEADFLALVGWRVIVKGRRNKDGASTEAHQFVKHLMSATGSPSVTSLANRYGWIGLGPSELKKYIKPTVDQKIIKWMATYTLRRLVAAASIDPYPNYSSTKSKERLFQNPNEKELLNTVETGAMLRVLDQDELYAKVGQCWKNRFGERKDLAPPNVRDLPWLLDKAREIATSIWDDHTRFQQLCLKEVALQKGLVVWADCEANMHPAC